MAATPPADKPGFLASLPSWWATLLIAAVSAVIGWGASKYEQGARDERQRQQNANLQRQITALKNGPIADYLADKRNAQIREQQELEAFRAEQARSYKDLANLAKQLKSSSKR